MRMRIVCTVLAVVLMMAVALPAMAIGPPMHPMGGGPMEKSCGCHKMMMTPAYMHATKAKACMRCHGTE